MTKRKLLLPAVLLAVSVSAAGCVNRTPSAKPAIPSSQAGVKLNRVSLTRLQPMGSACEELFASAEKGDWAQADKLCAGIAGQAQTTKANKLPAVRDALEKLRAAAAAKDKTALQAESNRIYKELLNFSVPYNAAVPSSLNMLKYYCRETMLSCGKGDKQGTAANIKRLLACWKGADASVSDGHRAAKAKVQAAADVLNRRFSAGDLKGTRAYCQQMLDSTAALEQECINQNV